MRIMGPMLTKHASPIMTRQMTFTCLRSLIKTTTVNTMVMTLIRVNSSKTTIIKISSSTMRTRINLSSTITHIIRMITTVMKWPRTPSVNLYRLIGSMIATKLKAILKTQDLRKDKDL